MSTLPRQRSSKGCITCKKRRRKCGEERPACKACADLGQECEGYAVQLRWDAGVASRGHLTGAKEPLREKAPQRERGRLRDIQKQKKEEQSEPLSSSDMSEDSFAGAEGPSSTYCASVLHSYDFDDSAVNQSESSPRIVHRRMLFQEFLTSGYLSLYAGRVDSDPLVPVLPSLCEQSDTLYNICIALQAYLSEGASGNFHEYYSVALNRFRAVLNNHAEQLSDAMLMAALLLCTIGMLQGTPWTVHLKGMEKLLQARLTMLPVRDPTAYAIEAIEVMGIMDLPTFVIGRQSPSLGIWRRYRSGRLLPQAAAPDAIEPMSGLPKSLIDLFSAADGERSEEGFWLWPGFEGNILQCHLWEAYRLAGMLDARRIRCQRDQAFPKAPSSARFSMVSSPHVHLPDNAIIVARLLSSLDAIRTRANQSEAEGLLIMNAIFYPLFIVTLAVLPDDSYQRWHILVREWFEEELNRSHSKSMELAWHVLEEMCLQRSNAAFLEVDDVARHRGFEIGLH